MAAISQQGLLTSGFHLSLTGLPTLTQNINVDGTPWIRYALLGNGAFQTETGTGNNGVNPNAGYPNGSTGQVNQYPQWAGLQSPGYPGPNIPGQMFECMCEVISGSSPNGSSDVINTWLGMVPGRTWIRVQALVGVSSDSGQWRFSLRRTGGSFVIAQATYNWSLNRI